MLSLARRKQRNWWAWAITSQHAFRPPHVATVPRAVHVARDATVAVTDGLTSILTDDELRAVLAHEMGHVRHDDVQRNMHVAIAAIGLGTNPVELYTRGGRRARRCEGYH